MRTEFLGLDYDPLDTEEAVAWLAARPADAPFAYIITPNVDHVVRITQRSADDPVWSAYRAAALCLCDSRILAKLAALRGVKLKIAAGSDITAQLLDRGLTPGDRLCVIGGDAAMLADLRARWPQQQWLHHQPPMGLLTNPAAMAEAAAFVADARARYTFLAIGSPQQELLAQAIVALGRAIGTGLCIGASIEFVTGRKARAPLWMRRLSLEWLHRLASEPRRLWRRYLVEGPRIALLVWRWHRKV
ncbi:exopolysaccharide biosynthesis WecB/TagA/CpsF family protein [Sphingomonas vulcanisoli]|uniref:Exopolysaccharide biosynthesis WecB/TagA/CpsF family protein n=1 Tax=Sphingomonas vulcanisoli TaxID=1658060 RepID=A0ABX0TQM3_9SPHN|nr:WecB/TagA/CpsF family glycosyltransferase [Sphingomonas vulcanisoli]NIJ07731.1 exopolysaccharide biosynthesis WecB/TagA/CpsF family protein [Sphingomonas vulcanisoli]